MSEWRWYAVGAISFMPDGRHMLTTAVHAARSKEEAKGMVYEGVKKEYPDANMVKITALMVHDRPPTYEDTLNVSTIPPD